MIEKSNPKLLSLEKRVKIAVRELWMLRKQCTDGSDVADVLEAVIDLLTKENNHVD